VTAPAISVRNVTKRFASHQALDGVTLDVAARESVVILGPSGCGKTTLLRLIAGLDVPDGGEIWLGNVNRIADLAMR
jgi:ABC-type sugar transport system ATPase subunit